MTPVEAERPALANALRRALVPALVLGLYFAAVDLVGTAVVVLTTAQQRDPAELLRRLVADVLSGVLLVPAGLGEQWLRRSSRALGRDLLVAAAIVVTTGPLILLAAAGATYASLRSGYGATDEAALASIAGLLAPVAAQTAFVMWALAVPAGVNALARARGVRLRWQVLLSATLGVAAALACAVVVPGYFALLGLDARLASVGLVAVGALAPLLLASADWLERRAFG